MALLPPNSLLGNAKMPIDRARVDAVFRSSHHPEGMPKGFVYAQRLAGPIGACTTPVMIGATAAALRGHSVLEYLVWGLPAALLTASLWTQFTLSSTTAEVHFRPGQVAVQSVHDVLYENPLDWHPLYNVRETRWHLELALGWDTQVCHQREWPDYEKLSAAAERALTSPG